LTAEPNPRAIIVVASVIERDETFLVTRRLQGVHLAGMWEFPGGKVDPGESHAAALARELVEELGVRASVNELVLCTTHAYEQDEVALYFYACELHDQPTPLLGQEMRWVPRRDLSRLRFPDADAELITRLTASAGR
jgi:mutator protein MutT